MKTLFDALVPGRCGVEIPAAFPRRVRLALWISGFVLGLCALLYEGSWFGRLSPERQVLLLERLYHHRCSPLRALVQWWKLMALITDRRTLAC